MIIKSKINDLFDLLILSIIRVWPLALNILIIKHFINYDQENLNNYILIITLGSIICTLSNYGILNFIMKFKDRSISNIINLFVNLKIPVSLFLFFVCILVLLINYYSNNFVNELISKKTLLFFFIIFFFGLNHINSFYFNSINKPKLASVFRYSLIGTIFYIYLVFIEKNYLYCLFYSTLISLAISYFFIFFTIKIKSLKLKKNTKFFNFLVKNRHRGFSSILSSLLLNVPLYISTFFYDGNELFIFYFVIKICNLFLIFNSVFENKFLYKYSLLFVKKNIPKIKTYLFYRTKLILLPIISLIIFLLIFKNNIFDYFNIGLENSSIYYFCILIGSIEIIIGPVIQYILFADIKIYYQRLQYFLYTTYYFLCFILIIIFNIYTAIYLIFILFIFHSLLLTFILYKKVKFY